MSYIETQLCLPLKNTKYKLIVKTEQESRNAGGRGHGRAGEVDRPPNDEATGGGADRGAVLAGAGSSTPELSGHSAHDGPEMRVLKLNHSLHRQKVWWINVNFSGDTSPVCL